MARFRSLLVLQCLWAVVSCFGVAKRAFILAKALSLTPLPPSQDPFYTAPPNFAAAAPGAILRIRPAPNVPSVLQNCSSAYNILYRTTDSQYQPTWAVTTLYLPFSTPGNATDSTSTTDMTGSSSTNSTNSTTSYSPGSYLLSFQTPYDSANIDLSPSYTVYGGALNTYGVPTFLGKGWYVSVPDYEGPNASFTAGIQSGHATLDSVRAVLNAGLGLTSDVKYAMSGYSGGALASEWAAELQVQYAPELKFSGAALGGLTPNVTSVLNTINGGPFAELIVNSILGLTSQWSAAAAYLTAQLNPSGPYNASTFLATRTKPLAYDDIFQNQNISDYFQGGMAALNNPIVQAVTNQDGIMGYHGVPRMPVFAYKAIKDEISVIADTDALVARYCGVGADILYQRNTVGGHVAEFINGQQRTIDWLTAAFEGTLNQTYNGTSGSGAGCTVQNVTVAVTSIDA